MSITWMIYLCVAAALAFGLVAGVFLTFSDFIMRSLRAVAPAAGMAAMQAINRKVYGSLFLMMFMGLAAVSVALAGNAVIFATGPAVAWIVGGGAVYLIGVFLVTVLFNVPMNKRLDALDPATAEATDYWTHYGTAWTRWNHVRSVASAAATGCFLVGALLLTHTV